MMKLLSWLSVVTYILPNGLFGYVLAMLVCGILFSYLVAYHLHGKPVYCESNSRIDGKTVVITGGSKGIGFAVAKELARRGGRIYIGSRVKCHGTSAIRHIINETYNYNVFFHPLDLADFASVRAFAGYIRTNVSKIHILINSAGISADREDRTKEGYDTVFTVNYLGHFLLTYLLLDMLKSSSPSRIINVTSMSHCTASLDLTVKEKKSGDMIYPGLRGYDVSKLALVLHVKELAKRLAGMDVVSHAVCPGPCLTGLWQQHGYGWPWYLSRIAALVIRPVALNPTEASQTIIYCAVTEDVDGTSGKYFTRCERSRESENTCDQQKAKDLWDISLLLTGCRDNGKTMKSSSSSQLNDDFSWKNNPVDQYGFAVPIDEPKRVKDMERG